jgi:glycosyltransferase involved in cell wall biosynthesis
MIKVQKIWSLLTRFRVRHLRLGIVGLVKLIRFHLMMSSKVSTTSDHRDWLVNQASLTILLTVYNQTILELEKSISSARSQTGANIRIVIFDDGSTLEETLIFLEKFKCLENETIIRSKNRGVVSARNQLIDLVTTDFLLFLDPDDSLNQDYVSSAFALLEKDRSIEIIYPDVLVVDTSKNSFSIWKTGPFDLKVLEKVNTLPMSSIVSTRLMKQLGGFQQIFRMDQKIGIYG